MVKLATIVLLALASVSNAATYYVASDHGDDDANGSSGEPWLTLYTSIPKLNPGDTLLCTGTFSEAPGYGSTRTVAGGGSVGQPLTIRANGTAVINLQDNSGDDATYSFTGSYIVIDGFGFTSTLTNGGGVWRVLLVFRQQLRGAESRGDELLRLARSGGRERRPSLVLSEQG